MPLLLISLVMTPLIPLISQAILCASIPRAPRHVIYRTASEKYYSETRLTAKRPWKKHHSQLGTTCASVNQCCISLLTNKSWYCRQLSAAVGSIGHAMELILGAGR